MSDLTSRNSADFGGINFHNTFDDMVVTAVQLQVGIYYCG